MNFFTYLTQSTQGNLACCNCRITKHGTDNTTRRACPNCGRAMYNMGTGFIPPRQSDKNEWEKVAFLVKHNFTFENLSAY